MKMATWKPWLAALLVFACTGAAFGEDAQGDAEPLVQAHSHNDYHQPNALFDALDQGFCSVEADVFLIEGDLLVAHDRDEVRAERTLEKLYLEPLAQRIEKNGGSVHTQASPFMLLIDFKNDGAACYEALKKLLQKYEQAFARGGEGRVQVVVSGDRPWELIEADEGRLIAYDGRVADLDDPARRESPPEVMPLVSDNWYTHFRWDGRGAMPAEEREKLSGIVDKAHGQGRRVRFWATPEVEEVWRELQQAGVDHLNTDQLKRLRKYLGE